MIDFNLSIQCMNENGISRTYKYGRRFRLPALPDCVQREEEKKKDKSV